MYKFPINPALGQEHAEGQKSWKWNGSAWDIIAVPNVQVEATKVAAEQAKAAADIAEASRDNALVSKNSAKVSELVANNAKNNAEASAVLANASKVSAGIMQTAAAASAVLAGVEKQGATVKATEAAVSASLAENHKNAAIAAQDGALESANDAADSSVLAADMAIAAGAEADEALASATLATAYAVKFDGPVANGLYSARYYADEAKRYVDTLIVGQVQANWNDEDPTSKSHIFNKPIIPTNNDQLTNGAGFITLAAARAGFSVVSGGTYDAATGKLTITPGPVLAPVATIGTYASLTGKPFIPAKTSELTNDAGFLKSADIVSGVSSVAGRSGAVTLTKSDVNLANVDNTSDVNKPISGAVQSALNSKANTNNPTFTGTVDGITRAMVGLGNVENKSSSTIRSEISQANIKEALSYTPLAMGGAYSQLDSLVRIGWSAAGTLRLAVDTTDFASTWPISIQGTAGLLNGQNAAYYLALGNATGILNVDKGGTGVNSLASLKAALAINNVSNTADANKPVSAPQQTAINAAQQAAQGYADTKTTAVRDELNVAIAAVPKFTVGKLHAMMLCF